MGLEYKSEQLFGEQKRVNKQNKQAVKEIVKVFKHTSVLLGFRAVSFARNIYLTMCVHKYIICLIRLERFLVI